MSVILETTIGDLTVDLYCEERPLCSKNFLKLCKVKYFNFCLFHSVQKNAVAQTGDPTGRGTGGESIFGRLYGEQARTFDMEIKPRIKHRKRGQLSMVNNGTGQHGSQFLITLAPEQDYLDEQQHTVFGEVVEGWDVLDKLNETYCDKQHRPFQDIRITHTIVLDDPTPDPDGLEIPDRSPEPDAAVLQSDRIAAFEKLDDAEGLTTEEAAELVAEKEQASNEQLLRIVEDIPDVEGLGPNDRSLFVCKLNPVTTSEDLEIIFSRFGPIKECAVVKDQKSDASLQYAFIEFERREDCENAFFKMENVLIDDRRIHVDFSQSMHKEMIEHRRKQKDGGRGRGGGRTVAGPSRLDHQQFVFEEEEEEEEDRKKERDRKKKKKKKKESSSSEEEERRKRRDEDRGRERKERADERRREERRWAEERQRIGRGDRDYERRTFVERERDRRDRERREERRDWGERREERRDREERRNDRRDRGDRREDREDRRDRGGRREDRGRFEERHRRRSRSRERR